MKIQKHSTVRTVFARFTFESFLPEFPVLMHKPAMVLEAPGVICLVIALVTVKSSLPCVDEPNV